MREENVVSPRRQARIATRTWLHEPVAQPIEPAAEAGHQGHHAWRFGHGTRWARDHPQVGEGAMPLYWKGHTSFPVAWCLKRLANGEEDNVWLKYRLIVDEVLKNKSAEPSAPVAPGARGSP